MNSSIVTTTVDDADKAEERPQSHHHEASRDRSCGKNDEDNADRRKMPPSTTSCKAETGRSVSSSPPTRKLDGLRMPSLRRRRDEKLRDGIMAYASSDEDDEEVGRRNVVGRTLNRQESANYTRHRRHNENYNHQEDDASADISGDWSVPSDGAADNHDPIRSSIAPFTATSRLSRQLTEHDIAMCQALDMDYERALEDRQVAWTARYQSVRQSTLFSIVFMVLLILTGTAFFLHQADSYWSVSEGLLFSIYTITTVGYGHLDMPSTPVFQLYVIFYIFVGIAMLTILVAQVYQCIALEASRVVTDAGDAHTRRNSMRMWLEARSTQQHRAAMQLQQQQEEGNGSSTNESDETSRHGNSANNNNNHTKNNIPYMLDDQVYSTHWDWADVAVWLLQKWDRLRVFLRENEFGRGVSVVLPFAVLIAIGAGVIGPLEGWTVVEAIYFAVVSLTTVGFGDYYPTRTASIWFCCIWLPFSVGFMSLYLANVAAFYIRLSDRNVARIGRVLRKRLQRAKERAEQERRAVLRRALRGQHGGDSSSLDDLALATEAAEAAQRPLTEVQEGITIVTVDHGAAANASLRQATNRMRGFDSIPTLDDIGDGERSSTLFPLNSDGTIVDTENPFGRQGADNNGSMSPLYRPGSAISYQRQRILQNSQKHMEIVSKSRTSSEERQKRRSSMTMKTMKDVLQMVHRNNNMSRSDSLGSEHSSPSRGSRLYEGGQGSSQLSFQVSGPESEYLSVRSSRTVLHHDRKTVRKKPSFALRALVQERFAEIIAADIAGYQNGIEIKEYTMTVKIEALKATAEKWLVPRRARKAFRAVAFEALFFVGEHGLITRGADALFSLTPFEFHEIFSPLLAAFGDAETMELWLEHTQALADVDLSPSEQGRFSAPHEYDLSSSTMDLPASKLPGPKLSAGDDDSERELGERISPSSETTAQSTVTSPSLPASPIAVDREIELPDIS